MPEQRPRSEPSHLSVRLVSGALVAIVLLVAAAAVAMQLVIMGFGGHNATPGPTLPDQAPDFPGPRLRVVPQEELTRYREEETAVLHGLGWNDRAHRTARVPVEDAMRMLARHGWPGEIPPRGTE